MNLGTRDLDGFFGEIVTSSPIERHKRGGDNAGTSPEPLTRPNNNTWSALLRDYRQPDGSQVARNEADGSSSSSFQPIAESKVRVLLTPGRKVRILSNSTRKLSRQATPGRPSSYSRLTKTYRERFTNDKEDESDDDESILTIKKRLKSAEDLTLDQVNRYEKMVQRHIRRSQVPPAVAETVPTADAGATSELMRFVEHQLGQLDLSPSSARLLREHEKQQEKRLISLTIAKRRSAVEIKRKIQHQQAAAREQVKAREDHEMKQLRASQLRQKAVKASTLFSQMHSAHHQRVVKEARLKSQVSQLQRQMQSEKTKNNAQASKIVRDVWGVFLRDQYDELRQEIRQQQQDQKQVVRQSEAQLQRFKSNFEDKLRELKDVAAAKAAEAGLEKKEVACEIERIRRNMQRQFQTEYQSLLQKIESKGEHQRFIRDEKAARLKQRLQKADYVFDM